ncbi:MAG TPA: LysR family transcriptional regulator [Rhizomicrobium sp.]|jgi:DNA-binding transcriptional LysR family regulator|nr:LysR family transcriptional regulator [Rhizomicrobium sp.]
MLKLDSLHAFVTIVQAGSISEAARRLQISKSVASERLAELERNVGATLLHRSTRGLALTEDGVAFIERAKRILHEVSEATTEITERRGELTGPLRLSVPVSFGILHLGPALNAFLKQNPGIELSLDLDDRFVSATDGFDAVIRHGPLPDTGWIAKRFASSRRLLVASPDYLKERGMPKTIGDLEQHRGIIYSNRGASDWRFRQAGRWSVVRPGTVMRVNNGIIMRDAALEGLGIALLSTFFFHDLLTAKKLRVVDVGAEAEPATIFIAYPNGRRISAKVLALVAHLRAAFGSPPYWERQV